MKDGEVYDSMMRVVERLEREPRFSLAWMLAYEWVLPKIIYKSEAERDGAVKEAVDRLLEEINKTNNLAASRRRMRGLANLTARIDALARGERLPDTRRKKRAKRRAA